MPRSRACRPEHSTPMFAAMPMLRKLSVLTLTLCLAAAPARAQFWGAPQAPPPARPPAQAPVQASRAGTGPAAGPRPAAAIAADATRALRSRFAAAVGNSRRAAFPARHVRHQRRPEVAQRGAGADRRRSADRRSPRSDGRRASIAAIAASSRATGPARRRPASSSAATSKRAPRSPATSPPAMPISAGNPDPTGINPAPNFALKRPQTAC